MFRRYAYRTGYVLLVLVLMAASHVNSLGFTNSVAASPSNGSLKNTNDQSWLAQASNIISIPLTTSKPTLDGICSEYSGGFVETFIDGNGQLATVYLIHNGLDLFVCMQAQPGAYAGRFGSLYLDPQGDGSSYDYAQQNDYSLRVNVVDGVNSSYIGTGVANGYVLDPSLDGLWEGVAISNANGETIEWQVSLGRFDLGNCGAIFGLAVYHHWFSAPGDDYGWPSSQWYDQPRTWQLAYLLGGPCNPPGDAGQIAYVFRGNTADAISFYNLLVTNGYTVTLVPLNAVLATDFSIFDLILIADDTGSLDMWGTPGLTDNQVNQIKLPNKPILGLGEGGYAFFGRMALFIGWPHGWHGPDDDTTNAGTPPAAAIFGALPSPLTSYVEPVNEVSIYLYGGSIPSDAFPIGLETPPTDHANLIIQGCRTLWGYSGNPLSMSLDGASLFLNSVAYMRSYQQCQPEQPIEPGLCLDIVKTANPVAGSTVNPGDVIEYTLTYTYNDDPKCNLPTQGWLTDYIPDGAEFVPGSASDGISPGPDGSLAWSVSPVSTPQTKSFKVQVVDSACATGQIANRATLALPTFMPLTSPDVTHTVDCGSIQLPNDGPMYAEEEVTIYPYPLLLGHPSQVEVKIANHSAFAQEVTVEFQTSPDRFGIGLSFNTFDTETIVIPANSSAIAEGIFIPTASGHYCIQIKITGPGLPTPIYTQRNLDVTESLQPGVPDTLTFSVGNPTPATADVQLVVDNTCPGWAAVITDPKGGLLNGMAPGEVRSASLEVTPPNPVTLGSGCHIDVQGWIGDQMIGGFRKLDVPPVHLPADVVPPWEEREISFIPEIPVAAYPGQICVELQNPLSTPQTVTLVFDVADFGAGIGFTTAKTQDFTLPPNSLGKYCVSWTPSASGTLHRCVRVTLQQTGYLDMHSQRNIDIRRMSLSNLIDLHVPFVIGNPDLVDHTLEFFPTIYGLNPGWQVGFLTELGGPPPDVLLAGEQVDLVMILIGLDQATPQAITGSDGFGNMTEIEVSVLLDGVEVGGFTVVIDDLQLFLPVVLK